MWDFTYFPFLTNNVIITKRKPGQVMKSAVATAPLEWILIESLAFFAPKFYRKSFCNMHYRIKVRKFHQPIIKLKNLNVKGWKFNPIKMAECRVTIKWWENIYTHIVHLLGFTKKYFSSAQLSFVMILLWGNKCGYS
jgi:hypothetical protein